jgi:hypothetical protein
MHLKNPIRFLCMEVAFHGSFSMPGKSVHFILVITSCMCVFVPLQADVHNRNVNMSHSKCRDVCVYKLVVSCGAAWGVCFCKCFSTKSLKCTAPAGDSPHYFCIIVPCDCSMWPVVCMQLLLLPCQTIFWFFLVMSLWILVATATIAKLSLGLCWNSL